MRASFVSVLPDLTCRKAECDESGLQRRFPLQLANISFYKSNSLAPILIFLSLRYGLYEFTVILAWLRPGSSINCHPRYTHSP